MRFFRITLGATVALLVVVGVTCFVLSSLGVVRLVPVLSNSMAPGLPIGSLAVALPVAPADVHVGDVIIFNDPDDPGRRVIHRVTFVYSEEEAVTLRGRTPGELALTTKGDNNAAADPWIVTIADQHIWRESAALPVLGWPSIALLRPEARLVLFALGGAVLVGAVLVVMWRRTEEQHS
ncbi:signal peptidase I [Rathayibacter toxicus]|uniref:Signal peptidase I n=1 Tax=Rathayibacter toxicus TaxID=145458 RepID=A0A2S5Y9N2_9MICO|nr:signal peptidase I [Rathayibacter toxicus]ALS57240.1 hypothetical protein APU90_05195 [Rathayibacter toxicus]PPG24038.1 signal peptidase I [Rathayibacter toxicus]PPG48076.1 signal peptidase I [Rathayibacter toxicus]PPH25289.1 signal peptidase I [Rathayibacter toxicus]PPH58535.1 signal peptidase I [Rathayibacter toxicus]